MALPDYDQKITLEEALSQFDFATSELVLHPFNGARENEVDARREHVTRAAQNTYLTASRWCGVIEGAQRKGSNNLPNRNLARNYIDHVSACTNVLRRKVLPWYERLEESEVEELRSLNKIADEPSYKVKLERVLSIKREKDIIENYVTLMGIMSTFVRDEFIGRMGDIDDGYRPKPKRGYISRIFSSSISKVKKGISNLRKYLTRDKVENPKP